MARSVYYLDVYATRPVMEQLLGAEAKCFLDLEFTQKFKVRLNVLLIFNSLSLLELDSNKI